jgi:hypothetical protein
MKFSAPPAAPLAGPGSPTVPPQPREASSIWMAGVVAPFAQNVMGGIGVAVIAGLLGMAIWPDSGVAVVKGAAIAGAVVFGGACAIRAFRDEIGMIVAAYAAGSLDATTEALRKENKRLVDEVEYLKSQGMVAHAWGAREAAERLVNDYYLAVAANVRDMNGYLARRASMERGMTRAEWETGIKFLQNAEVMDRGVILSPSEDAALAAIARHAAVSRVRIRAANGDMAAL